MAEALTGTSTTVAEQLAAAEQLYRALELPMPTALRDALLAVQAREERCAALDQRIAALEQEIAQREGRLAESQREIAARDREIAERRGRLGKLEYDLLDAQLQRDRIREEMQRIKDRMDGRV